MSEHTIDVRVDGDVVDITVEELTGLDRTRKAAEAPNSLIEQADSDDDHVHATPEIIDYIVDLAVSQTILTEELIGEMPDDEMSRFLGGVVSYAFGQEPDLDRDENDYTYEAGLELNDDGSVNLDDWQ